MSLLRAGGAARLGWVLVQRARLRKLTRLEGFKPLCFSRFLVPANVGHFIKTEYKDRIISIKAHAPINTMIKISANVNVGGAKLRKVNR